MTGQPRPSHTLAPPPPDQSTEVRVASGDTLRQALLAASAWLDLQAERVNALNVFPVPDGDTGTNMSLTMRAAADALKALPETATVGEVAKAAYQAAMMGARGNSGVILSQLFRGFAHALDGQVELTSPLFSEALAEASQVAYRGVSRPVEGTILTVSRRIAEAAAAAARLNEPPKGVLERAVRAAGEAVAQTPDQLDVLKRAGVVDAGGEGYRVILEGAWMWSTGRAIEESGARAAPTHAILDAFAHEETPFGFCTEVLVQDCGLPIPEVNAAMDALGESVIVVGDADLLRVHVHTLRPGRVLEFAVDHGTLAKVKVENMSLQHREFAAGTTAAEEHRPTGEIGVIAVAAGEGFQQVFRSMGAIVVEGGQTMNPSVQEILDAVNRSGYRQLVILPNNANIILTARHVAELTPHTVEVIPTETAPQGIGALLAFNYEADLTANVEAMAHAASSVHTIEVTAAVRDAEVDGLAVRTGQLMAIADGRVVAVDASAQEATLQALTPLPVDAAEIITIYYGRDAREAEAQALAQRIRETHAGLDVEIVSGGQPHYPFILSLE